MTLQILQYEFLGPIKLDDWGPPMEKVVYLILYREKDAFQIIYVDESEKTDQTDFFTKNEKFKCWISHSGSEKNLFLAILPMNDSSEKDRKRIVQKTITQYKPICNSSE